LKPRILIIGSSGFIGQHLIQRLDDSYDIWQIGRGINKIEHTINTDLLDPSSINLVRGLLTNINFKAILYLTNISSRNVPAHLTLEEANNLALANLLSGLTIQTEKLGFFSSVYVYKNPDNLQKISEISPVDPTSPYGKFKSSMEDQIIAWGEDQKIPVSLFRPEWVYGPGDTTKKLIPELCRAAASLQPYVVKVNPQETRQPIFITDVVNSISHWVNVEVTKPKEVYLLVGPKPINQIELLKIAQKKSVQPSNIVVEFVTTPNQHLNFSFDGSSTQEKLKWKPKFIPEDGMEEIITSFREDKSR
jgi:dTDP-glucose 4,6-dehydratase